MSAADHSTKSSTDYIASRRNSHYRIIHKRITLFSRLGRYDEVIFKGGLKANPPGVMSSGQLSLLPSGSADTDAEIEIDLLPLPRNENFPVVGEG